MNRLLVRGPSACLQAFLGHPLNPSAGDIGGDEKALAGTGWYLRNSDNQSHPVGRKKPNPWCLYDMHGNVSKWCAARPDGERGDATSAQLDGEEKALRDLRGGSWGLSAAECRSASRLSNAGTFRYFDIGLRVVCELD